MAGDRAAAPRGERAATRSGTPYPSAALAFAGTEHALRPARRSDAAARAATPRPTHARRRLLGARRASPRLSGAPSVRASARPTARRRTRRRGRGASRARRRRQQASARPSFDADGRVDRGGRSERAGAFERGAWAAIAPPPGMDPRDVRGRSLAAGGRLPPLRRALARGAPRRRTGRTTRGRARSRHHVPRRVRGGQRGRRRSSASARSRRLEPARTCAEHACGAVAQFVGRSADLVSDAIVVHAPPRDRRACAAGRIVACGDWGALVRLELGVAEHVGSVCGGHLSSIEATDDGGAVTVGVGGHALSRHAAARRAARGGADDARSPRARRSPKTARRGPAPRRRASFGATSGAWVRMSGDVGIAPARRRDLGGGAPRPRGLRRRRGHRGAARVDRLTSDVDRRRERAPATIASRRRTPPRAPIGKRPRMSRFLRVLIAITAVVHLPFVAAVGYLGLRAGGASPWPIAWLRGALGVLRLRRGARAPARRTSAAGTLGADARRRRRTSSTGARASGAIVPARSGRSLVLPIVRARCGTSRLAWPLARSTSGPTSPGSSCAATASSSGAGGSSCSERRREDRGLDPRSTATASRTSRISTSARSRPRAGARSGRAPRTRARRTSPSSPATWSRAAPRIHEDIAEVVGELRAKDGVFVSMGNHDYFGDGEPLITLLRDARRAACSATKGVVLERDGRSALPRRRSTTRGRSATTSSRPGRATGPTGCRPSSSRTIPIAFRALAEHGVALTARATRTADRSRSLSSRTAGSPSRASRTVPRRALPGRRLVALRAPRPRDDRAADAARRRARSRDPDAARGVRTGAILASWPSPLPTAARSTPSAPSR